MATTEIGYEDSYLASDKDIRRAIRAERVGKYIRKVGNVVSGAILFGGAAIASPAYSQEAKIDFMEGCETMIAQDGGEAIICDDDLIDIRADVVRRFSYQIDGVLAERGLYYNLLLDAGYDIDDRKGFTEFIVAFGGILLEINEKTNSLDGNDINDAMNLHVAHQKREGDPDSYAHAYDIFIAAFPNPELDIIGILDKNGYEYHGMI